MAAAVLKDVLGESVKNKEGADVPVDSLFGEGRFVGLYFSAHWCPPCRNFTPKLAKCYSKMREDGKTNLEIIFISRDREAKSYEDYYRSMPWLTVPFESQEIREKAKAHFKISGIPTLVLLDGSTGEIFNEDAVDKVEEDPEGAKFPWN